MRTRSKSHSYWREDSPLVPYYICFYQAKCPWILPRTYGLYIYLGKLAIQLVAPLPVLKSICPFLKCRNWDFTVSKIHYSYKPPSRNPFCSRVKTLAHTYRQQRKPSAYSTSPNLPLQFLMNFSPCLFHICITIDSWDFILKLLWHLSIYLFNRMAQKGKVSVKALTSLMEIVFGL